ncbi:hypothetical protein Cgig2_006513 [Carnegiea gigantea]|uniref:Cyclin n=1 Tax=Carnegiea gigantea TaxID=171969 RepID=A0A9Q1GRZ8_9CARY|nr:hypothetical protein Cgig2_006513 [Carnegiea gigantea]
MGFFNPKSTKSGLYSTLGLLIESSAENASETPQVLTFLASVLEKTIRANEKFLKRSRTKGGGTIFHGSSAPALSIRQYIERIHKYSKCSPSCFVAAYIYMDRFLQESNGYLTALNAHRLLIACVLVASKFHDDVCFNNAYYAKIGGVSTAEINRLELELLFNLNFRLHVTVGTFHQYCLLLTKAGTKTSSSSCLKERVSHACGFVRGC